MSFQVQGKSGQVQASAMPRGYALRVCVDSPRAGDIVDALHLLARSGAPPEADIIFQRWNTPDTRWYIIAQWSEEWAAEDWVKRREALLGNGG